MFAVNCSWVQVPDSTVNEPMVYGRELGEANGRCMGQAARSPAGQCDIGPMPWRVCGDTGDDEVDIIAHQHQAGQALLHLKVGEGKVYGNDIADPIGGHRCDLQGSRSGRNLREPMTASPGLRHSGRSSAACPYRDDAYQAMAR